MGTDGEPLFDEEDDEDEKAADAAEDDTDCVRPWDCVNCVICVGAPNAGDGVRRPFPLPLAPPRHSRSGA